MNQMYRNQPMSSGRNGQGNMPCPGSIPSCPCRQSSPLESMNQAQLIAHITEVSFAVIDITLYLDTHPHDCEALAYSQEMTAMRNAALKAYTRRFGPLTIDGTQDVSSNSWEWILQPWPWETVSKGGCR